MVELFNQRPVLNAASKEDSAQLGRDFDAVNLDAQDFDPQECLSLYGIPNFVQGSVLHMPFANGDFGTVVLGEFLEHCPYSAAVKALNETHRVLKHDGVVIVTIPLDPRPKEVQHPPHLLIEWEGGITSWHITVWSDEPFAKLLADTNFVELRDMRVDFDYGFCKGFGTVLRKIKH